MLRPDLETNALAHCNLNEDLNMQLDVMVTKAKEVLAIDSDALPEHVFIAFLKEGAKHYLNRGMTKITKKEYPDAEQLKAAALVQGQKNLENIMAGNIRIVGAAKATKTSGAVMTEARRLARNLVKDEIKRQGLKVSHFEAKEITKAANAILENDDSLIKQAEANLAERAKTPVKIDIKSIIKESPEKVKAAEEKKAKARATAAASKTQAGVVQPRARIPGMRPSAG